MGHMKSWWEKVKKFVNNITTITDTSKMEPAAVYKLLSYKWFRRTAKMAGLDLFQENFKPTVYTYFIISLLVLFLASGLYTMYSYEFEKKIICCSTMAFNGQGLIKYYGFVKNSKTIKEDIDFLMQIYVANANESLNKAYLEKVIKINVKIFKGGVTLLITAGVSVVIVPFVAYYFTGHLEPILPAYFPGLNENENTGYVVLSLHHIILSFIFVIGTAGVDLSLMTFVLHAYVMSQIFQNAVNDLNHKIKKQNKLEITSSMNNLILMHMDYSKYTKRIKTNFFEISLVQILMANLAMCILIYVIVEMNWFSAYFLIVTAFAQIFEFSFLGTTLEIVNDKIYDSICNISFVSLPIREQKKIISMIIIAQQPHNLTLGGFKELNITTFLSAMKTTYSVAALLINTKA